jgi:hypothetical protein
MYSVVHFSTVLFGKVYDSEGVIIIPVIGFITHKGPKGVLPQL